MKKYLSLLIATGFIAITALAADEIIQSDKVKIGRGVSSADKSIVLDTNSGANNPSITTTPAQNDVRIKTNKLKVGTGAAADQSIILNTGSGTPPAIKWNSSSGKIEFTNDGTNFKAIGSGSGSGSGINLLDNGGFEDGLTGFTSSGGVTAVETGSPNLLFGLKSASFDASASGQFLESVAVTVPEILKGQSCLSRVYYKFGDSNLVLKVMTGTGTVLGSQAFVASGSSVGSTEVPFLCPTSGSIKWRVESTAAAALIALDQTHLGEEDRISKLSQAQLVGTAKFAPAGGCRWQVTGVSTFADVPVDSACSVPTTTGDLAPNDAGKVPGFKILNAKPGAYQIVANGNFRHIVSSGNWPMFRFTDGTNFTTPQGVGINGASAVTVPVLTGLFNYAGTPPSPLNIRLQVGSSSGTQDYEIYNESGQSELEFQVYYFPSKSQTIFNAPQKDWIVDAVLTAGCGLSLSTVSSLTEMTCPGSALSNNTALPNILQARPACAGTEATTDNPCATASNGIAVDFPTETSVEACSKFTSLIANTSSGVDGNFQMVITQNNSQSIIQTAISDVRYGNATAGGHITHEPLTVCGKFKIPAGRSTFRVMYSQSAAGLGSNGVSVPHWTVRPITQSVSTPVLIGSVKTPSAGEERIDRAVVGGSGSGGFSNCTSDPCTVVTSNNSVTGVQRTSTGNYAVNFTNTWSDRPTCSVNSLQYGGAASVNCFHDYSGSGPQNQTIICVNSATNTYIDTGFSLMCMGPK